VCCGRPLISKGFLREAARQAETVTRTLAPLAEMGLPIVFCEPSCWSAVRDDHPQLLRGALQEQARSVARASITFEEWAARARGTAPIQGGPAQILHHGHCHQKALVGTAPAVGLLSQIAG